jgi:hypothetical protein
MTAGWLSFEKMLRGWTDLDEKDIYRAIEWQYSDGWISAAERTRRMHVARRYGRAT